MKKTMNEKEADKIIKSYESIGTFGASEAQYRKACLYLVEENQDMDAAVKLGKNYYMNNKPELALKYLTLASEHDNAPADAALGYLWYIGALGKRDYDKAYDFFAKGIRLMTGRDVRNDSFWKDDLRISLKSQEAYEDYIQMLFVLSILYRDGKGVERSDKKAVFLDRQLHWIMTESNYMRPLKSYPPMVDMDLADAALNDPSDPDHLDSALSYLYEAKKLTETEILYDPDESAFSFMKQIVSEIWEVKPVQPEDMDIYDLYVVMQYPCTVRFQCGRTKVVLRGVLSDDGGVSVCRGNTIYMSVDDWIAGATVARKPVPLANSECKNFTIEK